MVNAPVMSQALSSQPGLPISRHRRRHDEDAGADHRANDDHRGIEQPQAALKLGVETGVGQLAFPDGSLMHDPPSR